MTKIATMHMRKHPIAKAKQHFLVSCCLQSIFDNIHTIDSNSKKVLNRLIKRNLQLRDMILAHEFSEKDVNDLGKKANMIANVYKKFFIYDVVIFQKALLILIDNMYKDIPDTPKYKDLRKIYRFLEASSFTFFEHLDRLLDKSGKEIEKLRTTKSEKLAKQIFEIIS